MLDNESIEDSCLTLLRHATRLPSVREQEPSVGSGGREHVGARAGKRSERSRVWDGLRTPLTYLQDNKDDI